MMVNPAVAVAVQDHVHLAGAGRAVLGFFGADVHHPGPALVIHM